MIRLTMIGERGLAHFVLAAPYFRISGGSLWIGPGIDGERALVRYVDGHWHHAGVVWSGMRFEGKCRLVFGLPKDPVSVSGELAGLSISGATLSANGIPFAEYNSDHEAWRGVSVNAWWPAFRIESTGYRKPRTATEISEGLNPRPGDTPEGSGQPVTKPH